jgi:hypothetical protein
VKTELHPKAKCQQMRALLTPAYVHQEYRHKCKSNAISHVIDIYLWFTRKKTDNGKKEAKSLVAEVLYRP